ncbi:hypothetical protein B0H66DRAFT_215826 [Apodospora peruviana]|uniref:Nephrocystin 3-like N-terminal domain-containing protein n=1 Tax=Apodospora peruviana TaxID=516989 RepID=A0AAE0IDA6_9PEZI|nr:hypothetical protein B0H66DRAFT_215826 [Apodospora peruviana]
MVPQPEGISSTGISPVYEPERDTASAVVDIVVVHGLQGHPFKTWACNTPPSLPRLASQPPPGEKRGKRNSLRARILAPLRKSSPVLRPPGPAMTPVMTTATAPRSSLFVYWPRDLLPKDCPRSRVLVFGYDSKVTKYIKASTNKNTVFSHAKDLLFALSRARQPDRPIIFIAHSLGGIVVKEMLAQSSIATDAALHNIVDSTSAVVFFGTPHRGSQELAAVGHWARTFASTALRMESNDAILNALSLKTTDLERAQEAFSALWYKYDFRVKTFQEGLGLTGVNLSVLGNKVVPDYSSLIGDSRERAETIQANHMDMCRFTGPDDPNYLKLSGEVCEIYSSLVSLNQQRVHHDGHILRRNGPVPSVRSARSVLSKRSTRSINDKNRGLSASELETLNQLWYPGIYKRRQTVEEPAAQTCLWLFEQETYQDWLRYENQDGHCGLLWLKGKPGAGKSTLMKEALRRAEAQQVPTKFWTASFFFNAKGGQLEHSSMGLLRSVLHQLLPRYPSHLRRLSEILSSKALLSDEPSELDETELKKFLQSIFATKIEPRVVIFIDALDECDSTTMRSQAYLWREVTKTAHAAGNQLSVCMSSRHFPFISITDCPEIVVDHHNDQDIVTFVDQRLGLGISNTEPEWQSLRDSILGKSAGVFLWVALVVDEILQKWDEGESLQSLLGVVDNTPVELEALFSSLVDGVEPKLRPLTLQLFQWAVLATRPLRLYEWQHILGFISAPPSAPIRSLRTLRQSSHFVGSSEQLAKRIKTLSKGLIEMTFVARDWASSSSRSSSIRPGAGSMELDQGDNRIVQVIHGSVREFFVSGGASTLLDHGENSSFVAKGHLSIMHTCLTYIDIKELDALVNARVTPARLTPGPVLTADTSSVSSSEGSSSLPRENAQLEPTFLPVPPNQPRENPITSDSEREGDFRISLRGGGRRRGSRSVKSFGSAYSHGSSHGSRHGGLGASTVMAGIVAGSIAAGWSPIERRQDEDPVLEKLKASSDAAWDRDYFAQRMSMYRIAPDEISVNLSVRQVASEAAETQTLEDYAALLDYAVFELFTHAELADKAGADPSLVIDRLQADECRLWTRWLALAEELPLNTGLLYFAADQSLSSWVERFGGPEELLMRKELAITSAVIEAARRRNGHALAVLLRQFGYRDSYIDPKSRPITHLLAAKYEVELLQTFLASIQQYQSSRLNAITEGTPHVGFVDKLDSSSRAPLHVAVSRRDTRIASALLQYGADVNIVDAEGRTALHLACTSSSEEIPTALGVTGAPEFVVLSPNYYMVELLLRQGADVNRRDKDGHTPLHAICYNIPEPQVSMNGIQVPSSDPSGEVTSIINLLLQHGADVNAQSDILTTPLHIACRAGKTWRASCPNTLAAVERLLEAGAEPNARSTSHETPLHIAAARSDRQIVSTLLRHGADPLARDVLGQVPLHHAAWAANDGVAEELLARDPGRSHVNAKDNQDSTPLHLACQFHPVVGENDGDEEVRMRSIQLIERLLEHRALTASALNWLEMSPYRIAIRRKIPEVYNLLADHTPPSRASDSPSGQRKEREHGKLRDHGKNSEPETKPGTTSVPLETKPDAPLKSAEQPGSAKQPSLFRRLLQTWTVPSMGLGGAWPTAESPEPEETAQNDNSLVSTGSDNSGVQSLANNRESERSRVVNT